MGSRGRAFEDLLEEAFGGLPGACLFRQAAEFVIFRGRAFPRRGAPVDFVGAARGAPIALECKETRRRRFPLTESHFPRREREALERFSRAGGAAFLVVAFEREGVLGVYPWEDLAGLLGSRKSVAPGDARFVLPLSRVGELPGRLVESREENREEAGRSELPAREGGEVGWVR